RGPYCGDGIKNGSEACDAGASGSLTCTPSCTVRSDGVNCSAIPYCGDNIVQAAFEQCDDGDAAHAADGDQNNDNAYNGCTTSCEFSPFYCGDGIKNGNETCDDGEDNAAYGQGNCLYDCSAFAPYCGDGVRNGSGANTEQCDLGTANNVGGYGGCTVDCKRGPYCGDGIKNGSEACDAGASGSLTCTPSCTVRSDGVN
ncbi:MAG TPA: hypothetical protein VLC09_03505, partial [Polyangiaceae bacterium]|nr:hypothetical protein [Polyangiaceae bacterium]